MCSKCGVGNIRKGVQVVDWKESVVKHHARYVYCDCKDGIELKEKDNKTVATQR